MTAISEALSDEKLSPCPFCGGPAHCGQEPNAMECNYAGCSDADCIGYNLAYDFVTVETAIAAWNLRSGNGGEVRTDKDSLRILRQFAGQYRSGAAGAEMDCDAAMALALSIDDVLSALDIKP